MKVDEVWMKKCFPGKRSESDWPLNNFFRHAHWRIIVIGERYSSMFLHADGFETATYVIQFVGRKRWMVCSPEEGVKFGDAGLHDLFHPESIDLKAYPSLEHIDCTDTIVKPGGNYILPCSLVAPNIKLGYTYNQYGRSSHRRPQLR